MTLVVGLAVALLIAAGATWVGGILRGQDTRPARHARDTIRRDVAQAENDSNRQADPTLAWTAVDERQFRRLADEQRPGHTT